MHPILTVTMNPALDISAAVPAVVPEDKLRLERIRYEPGGGGINAARAVHKLGGGALALFPRGGSTGHKIERLLEAEGVPIAVRSIDGVSRQSLTVSEGRSAHQYRFVMPGPTLGEAEADDCLRAIEALSPAPEIVVLSGSLPEGVDDDFAARVVEIGKAAGSRVIVDTSRRALEAAASAGAYLLKPNLREFLELVGIQNHSDESIGQAALELLKRTGTTAMVISVGVGGALLATASGTLRFASPVVPIVSRVGAGDSMVAGIALALARGDDLTTATRHGVAAGAAAVMTPGSELCRPEDVERLYDEVRQQEPTAINTRAL